MKMMVAFDVLIEISTLTHLSNDIAIVNTGVYIETFDNIWMIHHL
jgi:hypothetical protein